MLVLHVLDRMSPGRYSEKRRYKDVQLADRKHVLRYGQERYEIVSSSHSDTQEGSVVKKCVFKERVRRFF